VLVLMMFLAACSSASGARRATTTTSTSPPGQSRGHTGGLVSQPGSGHERGGSKPAGSGIGKPQRGPTPPPDPGALGAKAAWEACDLLARSQIRGQFGGPVGPAVPTYPYCSWLIGKNSFLALDVEPHTSFAAATRFVVKLASVSGVGSEAMIANNRYLYFSQGQTSYWLLWQQVGDFSTLNTGQLAHLADDVLAAAGRGGPRREWKAPTLRTTTGPAVYFAGDSTAAGPEWAWVTYFATRATSTLAEYQVGSDLIVPQYFNWPLHLRAVALARRPRLVVYMGSANDGQPIFYQGAFRQPGSAGWDAAYEQLVGRMMKDVVTTGARLLVVGEPAMQSPSLTTAMAALDAVYATEAHRYKDVYFFDPGTILNGPSGQYEASIDIDGKLTPTRLDGIHLNIAGSVYLARHLGKLIEKLLPPQRRAPARGGANQNFGVG
jgi:hypothetical protein